MPRKFPPRLFWLVLPMAFFLYFYKLDAAGLLGPDEPRYASIAREMARSGDWVTPRLYGEPFYEKSPLLYWLEAVAFRLGLGGELAPRLPVALVAVAFLGFYWWILDREFGCRAAWMATLILATSGAWLVCSQAGVTDLPLTATFSAAMLLSLPWIGRGDTRFLPWAAALLGAAVLAKYLLALVLAAPLAIGLWLRRDRLRTEIRPLHIALPFLAIALPWYLLCYLRNGWPFLLVAWQHQVGRFTSGVSMHPQPWWFYLRLAPALVLPWTPLVLPMARRSLYRDPRRLFLLVWAVFVLTFFSAARGKLPGYLLPMLPAVAAMMALALNELESARIWLASVALLLAIFPVAQQVLPVALASGISRAALPEFHWTWLLPLTLAAAVWLLDGRGRRLAAVAAIAACATIGIVWLKVETMPDVDRIASARSIWKQIDGRADQVCVTNINRIRDTLDYYSVVPLPSCADSPRPLRIVQQPGQPLRLEEGAVARGPGARPGAGE